MKAEGSIAVQETVVCIHTYIPMVQEYEKIYETACREKPPPPATTTLSTSSFLFSFLLFNSNIVKGDAFFIVHIYIMLETSLLHEEV